MAITGVADYYQSVILDNILDDELRMNLDSEKISSRDDLPAIGSGGGDRDLFDIAILGGYLLALIVQFVGALLYFEVI